MVGKKRNKMMRTLSLWIAALALSALVGASPAEGSASDKAEGGSWKFVSSPDFFNFDVPEPWPKWDKAVDWYLSQVEKETPEFLLVAGDMVNAHWWEGPRCIEQMGALYYESWKRRMDKHGLTYYTCVGDHELGDDPWPEDKFKLVPHFERVLTEHMAMPQNGPENKKGLAYYFREGDVLVVTVETFEPVDGKLRVNVLGEQLDWLRNVLEDNQDAKFIVVQGHAPVFGPVASRSSSRLMVEGGKDSAFWKAMVAGGVDVYLCGEHHAVTCTESDGIQQIVHGSSWGRKVVNTQDFLVGKVTPNALHLTMKSFPMEARGDHMWNLHKSRGPREIVEIPESARRDGPQVTGKVTIRHTEDGNEFVKRSGVFLNSEQ